MNDKVRKSAPTRKLADALVRDWKANLQLGLFEKDAALKQVGSHSGTFMERAMAALDALESGSVVTGEDIRFSCTEKKIAPHHPNAWGALISSAVKKGLIRETGRWVPMRDVRSKARRTPEYYRTEVIFDQ